MAATAIVPTKSSRVTSSPVAAGVAGALAAADATNGNSFVNTGREILVVKTDGTNRTITFFDKNGVAVNAAATTIAKEKIFVFGPFKRYDYGDPVVFKASNNAVEVAVITLDELASFGTNR